MTDWLTAYVHTQSRSLAYVPRETARFERSTSQPVGVWTIAILHDRDLGAVTLSITTTKNGQDSVRLCITTVVVFDSCWNRLHERSLLVINLIDQRQRNNRLCWPKVAWGNNLLSVASVKAATLFFTCTFVKFIYLFIYMYIYIYIYIYLFVFFVWLSEYCYAIIILHFVLAVERRSGRRISGVATQPRRNA